MRQENYRYSLLFLAVSSLLSMLICLPQLHGFFNRSFKEELFIFNILLSHSFTLNLIIYLLLLAITLLINKVKFTLWLNCIFYFLLNSILFFDTAIYSVFKYHINGLIVNILTSEGAKDSVVFGTTTIIWTVIILSLVLATLLSVTKLYTYLKENEVVDKVFSYTKRFFLIFILLILLDKGLYAHADLINDMPIVRSSGRFLLYQPLTIKRFMAKNFNYDLAANDKIKVRTKYSDLNYPKNPLEFKDSTNYNIVIVVLDSWREDIIQPEYMPHMSMIRDSLIDFKKHYSGGNATRFGIFTLLYGLYGNLWHSILAERRSSVLLDVVQQKNYDVRISSSTTLNWPEFRKTAFINVENEIFDSYEQLNKAERDTAQIGDFISYLDTRDKEKPFFSFLLLDSPHAPYYALKEFEKFTQSNEEINYLDEESMKKSKEAYLNSVYFSDHLLNKLYKRLKQKDLAKNTVFIFTGDHGEAFGENGLYGHTSAFHKAQTHVPFLMHIPKKKAEKITQVTSHIDLVPTLLPMLGVKNASKDYSLGLNLFKENSRKGVVSGGWSKSAYITAQHTIIFPTKSYSLRSLEIRDSNYTFVENTEEILKKESSALMNISINMSSYYSF